MIRSRVEIISRAVVEISGVLCAADVPDLRSGVGWAQLKGWSSKITRLDTISPGTAGF
jgi:hypothetical protein